MKIGTYAAPPAGLPGVVDATTTQPDGSQVVRVGDHWWSAGDCRGGPQSSPQPPRNDARK